GATGKPDGIPPVPPKASEAAFDYLLKRFETMSRMPVGFVNDCPLGEEGADEPEGTPTTPERPAAAGDPDADSDSDPDEPGAESAGETETANETQPERPAATTQRPMSRRALKRREKRLREAAKREKRAARMAAKTV